MKLVELYLDEIRRHLPPRNREDIVKEINSTLLDMIEDRNPNPSQPVDEETVKAVLKEFGAPRDVAVQYGAKTYLIGPHMFPTYVQVLKIVLIVIAALNILGFVVTILSKSSLDAGLFDTIFQIVGGLMSSLFTGFGIVTLSFAAIEWTTPEEWNIKAGEEWEPEQLIKEEHTQKVNYAGLAFEITLTLVFIAVLNFFLDRIGIYYFDESGWVSTPILNQNFNRYVPWITAYALLDIGLNFYLLRTGVWDKFAIIGRLLINVIKMAVNIAIIVGPAIITVSESAWRNLNFDIDNTAQQLTQGLNIGIDIVLGLAIFGLVVESIKLLYTNFIKGKHAYIEISNK